MPDPGPAGAAWLERKFEQVSPTKDCDFPDCTEPREPRKPGKPGPLPKFCAAHNNPGDRQRAYRAAQRRKEGVAAPETPAARDPLPQVLARRQHQRAVFNELAPRLTAALEALAAADAAATDADAVAEHVEAVEQAAADRVREAEEARETAQAAATASRATTQYTLLAAVTALADRDAAYAEAAAALREAADADGRAQAARTARDELAARHQEHRHQHRELTRDHERLTTQHQELDTQYRALSAEHRALQEAHAETTVKAGRLEGELAALRPQAEALAARHEQLNERLRTAIGDLATATARAEALQRQLDTEQAERTRERDEYGRAAEGLRAQLQKQQDELDALRAVVESNDEQHESGPETAGDRDDGGEVGGREETGESHVAAIVDLGTRGGSGWSLVRKDVGWDRWSVRRDGEHVGAVEPEHAMTGRRTLLGWSATRNLMPLRPRGRDKRHRTRDAAAEAVIDAELHSRPERSIAPAAEWDRLSEQDATELAQAAVPLATADPQRGGRLAHLPAPARAAALRIATRGPRDGDLESLRSVPNLGRSKEAKRLRTALDAAQQTEQATERAPGSP